MSVSICAVAIDAASVEKANILLHRGRDRVTFRFGLLARESDFAFHPALHRGSQGRKPKSFGSKPSRSLEGPSRAIRVTCDRVSQKRITFHLTHCFTGKALYLNGDNGRKKEASLSRKGEVPAGPSRAI